LPVGSLEPGGEGSSFGPLENVWHRSGDRMAVVADFCVRRAGPVFAGMLILTGIGWFSGELRMACIGSFILVMVLLSMMIPIVYFTTVASLLVDEETLRLRNVLSFSRHDVILLRWPGAAGNRTARRWNTITKIISKPWGDGALVFIYHGRWHEAGHFTSGVARALEERLARAKALIAALEPPET